MVAQDLAEMLTHYFRYTAATLDMNLEGVSPEDARRKPQPAGNCVAWVLGHLVNARFGMLSLLQAEAPVDPAPYERFTRRGAAADDDVDLPSLATLRADLTATQKSLLAGLADLSDAVANAPAPFSPTQWEKETVGSLLVALAFHEGYHAGQVGMLRRLLGMPGAIA